VPENPTPRATHPPSWLFVLSPSGATRIQPFIGRPVISNRRKRETAEHRLFGHAVLVGELLADAVREVLVAFPNPSPTRGSLARSRD
jgi:hypothetical protein